jgi:hypothetical protein
MTESVDTVCVLMGYSKNVKFDILHCSSMYPAYHGSKFSGNCRSLTRLVLGVTDRSMVSRRVASMGGYSVGRVSTDVRWLIFELRGMVQNTRRSVVQTKSHK